MANIVSQIGFGPTFQTGYLRIVGNMLYFHDQAHVGKPANMPFVHFSARAGLIGFRARNCFIRMHTDPVNHLSESGAP